MERRRRKKKKRAEMESEVEYVVPNTVEYETPEKGIGIGVTTRPTPRCFPGLSAGGGGAK